VIAGVPVDGSWNPDEPIDRLRDMNRVDPSDANKLVSTCDTGMGFATAPLRFAELVSSFGRNGSLESLSRARSSTKLSPTSLPGCLVESLSFVA
jgi:hypothetical protein